jgi:hypothetical protein
MRCWHRGFWGCVKLRVKEKDGGYQYKKNGKRIKGMIAASGKAYTLHLRNLKVPARKFPGESLCLAHQKVQ